MGKGVGKYTRGLLQPLKISWSLVHKRVKIGPEVSPTSDGIINGGNGNVRNHSWSFLLSGRLGTSSFKLTSFKWDNLLSLDIILLHGAL